MLHQHKASPSLRQAATWLLLFGISATTGFERKSLTSSHEHALPIPSRLAVDDAWNRSPDIFNAVHNAMRQWGSSLHHNGMSFFLAYVPEGVLLHHGNDGPETPLGHPEWLAFEVEHAEQFALKWEEVDVNSSVSDNDDGTMSPRDVIVSGGYLHTYITTKTLPFLYIDGMSAAKSRLGTMDSQDYILRNISGGWMDFASKEGEMLSEQNGDLNGPAELKKRSPSPMSDPRIQRRHPRTRFDSATMASDSPWDDWTRAADLCSFARSFDLEGVIRMEAGFEIIKCDFSSGLQQVQALKRPDNLTEHFGGEWAQTFGSLEYLRGMEERYGGIGAGRVRVDYSSMVSAFFFPVNLTNSDAGRPELPRMKNLSEADRSEIKDYLNETITSRMGAIEPDSTTSSIDWQGVSDMIVGRYADRIRYMAEGVTSLREMTQEVRYLLTVFIKFPDTKDGAQQDQQTDIENAIDACTKFHLYGVFSPTVPQLSLSDEMIFNAFLQVSQDICAALFQIYILTDTTFDNQDEAAALEDTRIIAQELIHYLGWTRFKQCRPGCGLGEVCAIPMFSFGTVEQYVSPKCVNDSMPSRNGPGTYYWE